MPLWAGPVDDLDARIVAALLKNGRASYAVIGDEVGLSAPAVKRRVDRLRTAGAIIGFSARVDPAAMGWMMIGLGTFMMVLMFVPAIMAGLTGYYLRKRKHWKFCIVASAIQCIHAPLGTVLCGFTVIVLVRRSVRDLFKYGEPPVTDEDYE